MPVRYDHPFTCGFRGRPGFSGTDGSAGMDGSDGTMGSTDPDHPSPEGSGGSDGLAGRDGWGGATGADGPVTVVFDPAVKPYLGAIHLPEGPGVVLREDKVGPLW